jgi:hypothetical protein
VTEGVAGSLQQAGLRTYMARAAKPGQRLPATGREAEQSAPTREYGFRLGKLSVRYSEETAGPDPASAAMEHARLRARLERATFDGEYEVAALRSRLGGPSPPQPDLSGATPRQRGAMAYAAMQAMPDAPAARTSLGVV